MSGRQEFLTESRDFWHDSAQHDKKQFLASSAIAATGLICTGLGIGTLLSGDIEGTVGLVIGGSLATTFGKTAYNEFQNFANTTALQAIRQNQINETAEE